MCGSVSHAIETHWRPPQKVEPDLALKPHKMSEPGQHTRPGYRTLRRAVCGQGIGKAGGRGGGVRWCDTRVSGCDRCAHRCGTSAGTGMAGARPAALEPSTTSAAAARRPAPAGSARRRTAGPEGGELLVDVLMSARWTLLRLPSGHDQGFESMPACTADILVQRHALTSMDHHVV